MEADYFLPDKLGQILKFKNEKATAVEVVCQ